MKKFVLVLMCATSAYANQNACVVGRAPYTAVKWYLASAERKTLYTQTFKLGLQKVETHINNGNWGVIFDIDETLLNNMAYEKNYVINKCKNYDIVSWNNFLKTEKSIATPGASNITCSIKKLGGYVALITNREPLGDIAIEKATEDNLKHEGICFDTIIFADNNTKHDKNSRFNAINSGVYKNLTYTKKLPAMNVVAYFGDNIQDFPKIQQSVAINESQTSQYFAKFGESYFLLPNPIYGSWMNNKFD